MSNYIALLRGINVGGSNKLPMKELKALLQANGFSNIKTYIQSGNIVFSHTSTNTLEIASHIQSLIKDRFGFEPKTLVLTVTQYRAMVKNNPFPEGGEDPKTLHLYFLEQTPAAPALNKLVEIQKDTERYVLTESVFYLHAPEGIGRSKLAEKVEKLLGVNATARNWRSAQKILELAEQD